MTLRDARRQRGWTQVDLSQRSGISQVAISTLETGKTACPSWDTVSKLCKALGVKPESIFPVTDRKTAVAS